MGAHGTWQQTGGGGGGGSDLLLPAVAVVILVAIAVPVLLAILHALVAVLWALVALVAASGVAIGLYRWRRPPPEQRVQARVLRRMVVPRWAPDPQELPPPAPQPRAIDQRPVHLHFHGLSPDDVAEAVRRAGEASTG